MKLALSAFEADRTHCSGEHGGSVDADRQAWVPGKGVPLGALQGGSLGKGSFLRFRGNGTVMAAGLAEPFGWWRRAALSHPPCAALFQGLFDHPILPPRRQILQ